MARMTLDVNGKVQTIDADPDMPLLYALRNELSLNNPHFGCGLARRRPRQPARVHHPRHFGTPSARPLGLGARVGR